MLASSNSTGRDVWLKGFAKSTARVYRNGYENFIRFMNETEVGGWDDKRLLKKREIDLQQRNYAFEQKVVEFHEWLSRTSNRPSDNTKKAYMSSMCSFFAFHRMDLKFTKPQRNQIWRRAKPVRKYYDFKLEDLRRMSEVANPKERYVLLVGKSLGLRASDFVRLRQGTFEANLRGDPPISLGEIYTTKEGVKATPFLDEDAVEAIKTWLQILKSKGRRNPDARMINISKQEVDLIIKKLVKRAGINTGNEIPRFHQLRVFLATRLSSVTSESRWKQILGKTISEGAYIKPFRLRDDYAKVLPHTTIQEKVAQEEVIKLKKEVATLRKREDLSRGDVDWLRQEVKKLEQELNNVKKKLKQLELKELPNLLKDW